MRPAPVQPGRVVSFSGLFRGLRESPVENVRWGGAATTLTAMALPLVTPSTLSTDPVELPGAQRSAVPHDGARGRIDAAFAAMPLAVDVPSPAFPLTEVWVTEELGPATPAESEEPMQRTAETTDSQAEEGSEGGDEQSGRQPQPPPRRPTSELRRVEGVRPAFVAAVHLPTAQLEGDETFQLREPGDVAGLATSLARLGQLFPIDVRPRNGRYQVIAGFRRLAAIRFLQRDRVLARVHEGLPDAEALVLALSQSLEVQALRPDELEALQLRLESEGRLSAQARGLIEAARIAPGSDLNPEGRGDSAGDEDGEEEVDLDELGADVVGRFEGISQDLHSMTEMWDDLADAHRRALLGHLRYYADLHDWLARRR